MKNWGVKAKPNIFSIRLLGMLVAIFAPKRPPTRKPMEIINAA